MNVTVNRTTFALLVWSVFGGLRAHAQPKYSVTNLGASAIDARGINNSGQVTGVFLDNNGFPRGFRTEANKPVNLPADNISSLLGPSQTQPEKINDAGQVVGWGLFGGFYQPFRTASNMPIKSGDLLGSPSVGDGYAYGINNDGWMVGRDVNVRAFRTAPNAPINPATDELGVLPGHTVSSALAINSSGQVAGWSTAPGSTGRAFRSTPIGQPVVLTDLGSLGSNQGSDISAAYGINDSGVVVGESTTPVSVAHAFRTAPNSVINPATDDLGVLDNAMPSPRSTALAVNNAGQVVGWSSVAVGSSQHAFLHTGGVMYDLNKLIPAGSGWELGIAYDINNAGQIVGSGIHDGFSRAFRLDPGQPYSAAIQQPINADGSSVFSASKGTIPVKFKLIWNGAPTCALPAATISLVRIAPGDVTVIDPAVYQTPSVTGTRYGVSECQYTYNVGTSSLALGVYRVDISFNGTFVGSAVFKLQ